MRITSLARYLSLGLAMLLAAGCMAWPASKPKLKVVRVRKVPPIGPPVWRVDLRAFGYADHVGQLWKTTSGTSFTGPLGYALFVDQHTLIVAFVRREQPRLTPRGQLQQTSPLRFQAVSFRADSGQLVAQRDWGMSSRYSHRVIGSTGKLVLWQETKIALYSSALELLKELALPSSLKQSEAGHWGPDRSPSGKTIWLVLGHNDHADYRLLDSETLTSLGSWSEAGELVGEVIPLAFADDRVAGISIAQRGHSSKATGRVGGDNRERQVNLQEGPVTVRRLNGAWVAACEGGGCGIPYFVNNDVLALDAFTQLRLIGVDGQPLSPLFIIQDRGSGSLEMFTSGVFRACAQGDRFAVPLFSPRPEIGQYFAPPDICDLARILVFDLPSGQWIAALEAYEYNIEQICDAALSPDGTLLALFRQEGIVEVYPLPAPHAK